MATKSNLTKQDKRFIFKNCRVRWPKIFESQTTAFTPYPHYSIQVLLGAEGAPLIKQYEEHLKNIFVKELGQAEGAKAFNLYQNDKGRYRIRYDAGLGQYYVNLRRKAELGKPSVFHADGTPVDQMEGIIKGGDYCDVMEDAYFFDKGQFSRGISATLLGVRYQREGDPLSSAPVAGASEWDEAPKAPETNGLEDFI